MNIGDKFYKPVDDQVYANAASECTELQDRTIEDKGEYFEIVPIITAVTVEDYDNAIESHLKRERIARGYTVREPSDYLGSSVERWNQDAIDWIAHRDEVMLYGLEVQNKYINGEDVPELSAFIANLPNINWTLE